MKPLSRSDFILLPVVILLSWLLLTQPVLAGPPAPVTFFITQPDGVAFEARTWGDEHSNGTETMTGYTILQDVKTGYWFYAEIDHITGHLRITLRMVGKDTPPSSSYGARPLFLSRQSQTIISQGPVGSASIPVLILLVQYNNQPAITTETDWIGRFFGPTNSVKDYYQEVSYDQLTLAPATEACGATSSDGVTHWMTLGVTHPNSGGPSIARAALSAADNCINYALFDSNGDGDITSNELIPVVIVAGYENSYGGAVAFMPNVWGHQSSVYYKSVSDGVTVVDYGQFGEWHAASWDPAGHQATIGLMVHEIGHLIGWPDLYDTLPPGNPDSEGVGEWSVMASGLWLSARYLGDTPAHPSAWEKWYQGWLTPLQLQGTNLNQAIPRVEDNKNGSVIQLRDNPNGVDWRYGDSSGVGEYFLVENRQKIGYDTHLRGCGLLIWHLDEGVTFKNSANGDETHKLVDLEEADGLNDLDHQINRGDGGDTYPGEANNITFNTLASPNSRLYDNSPSGISISNISPGCADVKSATFTTVASPHLQVTITPVPDPIEVTTTMITYTITLNNKGDGDATGVRITNTIPAGTSYINGSASGGGAETQAGSGVIAWPPLTVAAVSTVTRSFQVLINVPLKEGDKLINVVSVNSDQGIVIENLEQVEIVGARQIYLPAIFGRN
jgi:M6 family metalloprotease-like protein/uncharacterized repeat protein (TIGR01451 family)